jgi:hypothetical protein
MDVQPWQLRRGAGHFCSMACRGRHHALVRSGANSPTWKGGERKDSFGYVWILRKEHPRAVGTGYVKRATLVAEDNLGRYLLPGELVHHINGVMDDDRPQNLAVIMRAEHNTIHATKPNHGMVKSRCLQCGADIWDYASAKRRFCNWACSVRFNKPRLGTGKGDGKARVLR